ncbi:large subunit ribosomal protein L1 [Marchantia polymorpha subsp. ruderalis]
MAALRHLLQRAAFVNLPHRSCSSTPIVAYKFPFLSKFTSGFSTHEPSDSLPVAGSPVVGAADGAVDQSVVEPDLNGEDGLSSFKPRVANLPEDLTPEQLSEISAVDGSSSLAKKFSQKEGQDEDVALPYFTKAAQVKGKEPMVLAEAIKELKAGAKARFDETVEVHVRLGIDTRRSDQMVRGAATLPHGTGKVVRVAVFAEGAAAQEAESAGADVVGADDLITMIQESGGKLNFDKCIATPSFMPRLGKVARILGPRGLMPNPKVGTVTNNVGEAVRAAKQGLVDFRADKSGIVHAGLGKVSFKDEALFANIAAFTGALLAAKPTGLKKTSRYAGYVNSFTLSSTMGPGVRVTIQSVAQAADGYMKSAEAR